MGINLTKYSPNCILKYDGFDEITACGNLSGEIDGYQFYGECKDRQAIKLNFLSNYLAIQYIVKLKVKN